MLMSGGQFAQSLAQHYLSLGEVGQVHHHQQILQGDTTVRLRAGTPQIDPGQIASTSRAVLTRDSNPD
jgi:flavin reductase (DIM6/NTAB) family NADH-FMN oxidoreductase RutF